MARPFAMAGLNCIHLLFATIIVLGCSHSSIWSVKLVYRPYGPKMCREVCTDSQDSFFFVLEDLSCNRIPAPRGNFSNIITCEADITVASLAGMANWDICYKLHNNTETHLRLNKEPTCSRDLKLVQNTRDTILHRACEEGWLSVVKYILAQGIADINCRKKHGRTPVMAAVSRGHGPVFDFLVSQGCNMSTVDDNNDNILHVACEGDAVEIVKKLVVNMSFDIETIGNHGDTPVLRTVYSGHMKLFKYLNSSGCNLKAIDKDGNNILHKSSMGGHVDIMEYIISVNISDIESKNQIKRTPVLQAARYGHKNVFDFLVSKGCDLTVVVGGRNILHLACKWGNVDIVKYIVSMNIVSKESRSRDGLTPVMYAVYYGHRKVFDFLVSKGCNLKAVDKKEGNNILHIACAAGRVDMVKQIVSMNIVNIDSKTRPTGWTPVLLALYYGHRKVFDFLVSKGCNLKAVGKKEGNNILHIACAAGRVDMVKQIVSMNIVNIDSKTRVRAFTPVMQAVYNGKRKVFDFLVSKGCNIKAVDKEGNNTLHYACRGHQVEMVKYLNTLPALEGMKKAKNKLC